MVEMSRTLSVCQKEISELKEEAAGEKESTNKSFSTGVKGLKKWDKRSVTENTYCETCKIKTESGKTFSIPCLCTMLIVFSPSSTGRKQW